jgi:Ran GTPase-activating protein (RanGAP) involved in mRNA processing and transport
MNEIIEKIKEAEALLLIKKAEASTGKAIDEINRALRYLADARTTCRMLTVTLNS